MQYKNYRDNIKLSRLGMGVMRLPVKDGEDKASARPVYGAGDQLL